MDRPPNSDPHVRKVITVLQRYMYFSSQPYQSLPLTRAGSRAYRSRGDLTHVCDPCRYDARRSFHCFQKTTSSIGRFASFGAATEKL
jgi:hypothetical protein